MSAFSRNVAANLLGTGWSSLVQLLAVPVLISLVGVASYALVGFYASLVALLAVLDLGLSAGLTRKMAGVRSGPDLERASHLLRTYETVYIVAGLAIGGGLVLAAPFIAGSWLMSAELSEAEIRECVALMGLLTALRWPITPYVATLQGLQKQVGLSAVGAAAVTLANGGGVVLLAFTAPAIGTFFAWQCACATAQFLALRALALRALPRRDAAPRFSAALLRDGWTFAAGMTGITLTAIVLTQGDKLILSKLLPLEEFGYYSIALVLATALQVITIPVFNAALPHLCERVSARDEQGLQNSFRSSSALMNALLVPPSLFLALFSHDLLLLWTRDPVIAARAAPLLSLLVAGTLLNGFMNVPYALQLARANTRIGLTINTLLCVLMLPVIVVLTESYGIAGGAAVSPILNGLYLLVGLPLTYRVCAWPGRNPDFLGDLARQQGASILFLVVVRLTLPEGSAPILQALVLAIALAAALALSIFSTPVAKGFMSSLLRGENRGGL